jgi:hypothetical protein
MQKEIKYFELQSENSSLKSRDASSTMWQHVDQIRV